MKYFAHLTAFAVLLLAPPGAASKNLRRLAKPQCGDLKCNGGETSSSCPGDCGGPVTTTTATTTQATTTSQGTTVATTAGTTTTLLPQNELCGFCQSTLSDATPTPCTSDANCPSSSLQECDSASDVPGQTCTSSSDCLPNKGKVKGRCVETTLVDPCRLEFTCAPTGSPSLTPSLKPSLSSYPSLRTSRSPSLHPTTTVAPSFIAGTIATGQLCSVNSDCASRQCINGACYASDKCQPLKHDENSQFATQQTLLLFVGSGFSDLGTWETEANRAFSVFQNYNMYKSTTTQYTALYSTTLSPTPFCDYWCSNIERLLCCDIATARSLAADCSPFGSSFHVNVQTVVVHNDVKYGGAGYISSNVATTSINSSGPLVAIHELGHSQFELRDEYSTGNGASVNCDSTSNCDKWSDLIGNSAVTNAGYNPVGCIAACKDNAYYAGEVSFMEYLSSPVGAVNDRYTCCSYQVVTKSMPSYCNVFDFTPGDLLNYCKNNDYQNYGSTSYDPPPLSGSDDSGGDYIQLAEATVVNIELAEDGTEESWIIAGGGTGVFKRKNVMGDWASLAAASNDVGEVYLTQVELSNNQRLTYFLRTEQTLGVPPEAVDSNTFDRIDIAASTLELAIDTGGQEVVSVSARRIPVSQSSTESLFD